MDKEAILGVVIMVVCCWGSAALFFCIGLWAGRRKTPMHFWAGTDIDPKTVSDIPAYNHENSVMWKAYSIPYWIAGAFSLFPGWGNWCAIAAGILIGLACFPGLLILIRHYRKIETKYICR